MGIPIRIHEDIYEEEKAALLVVVAGLSDGRKVFLAITPGYRESTESWSAVLRDLKKRGLGAPRLVVGDGHPTSHGRSKTEARIPR